MGLLAFSYIVFLFIIWIVLSYGAIRSILPKKEKNKGYVNRKTPSVLVMIPCKGTDISLTRNLKSAMQQNYPNYSVIAIIESQSDLAFKSIKASGIKYMLANSKCKNCSGKVRNLASAISRFKNFDRYCIMDSDVHVGKSWLSLLVASMNDGTGMATAFPIFNPVDGAFWSKAKHLWGFVGFGLMENEKTRFGWGGTLLFRKSLLRGDGFTKI